MLSLATSPIASIDGYVGAYCEPPALIFGPGLPSRVLAIYGGSDRTLDPSVPQLMRASLGDVGKVVVLDAGHDFLFRGEAAPRPLRWITRRLGCIPDNQALEASLRWIVEFAAELPIRK